MRIRSISKTISALHERGAFEWQALMVLTLVCSAIWAFVELADEVMEGETLTFDERIVVVMRRDADPSQPIGPEWLAGAARDITSLGGVVVLALMIGAVAGFLAIEGRYRAMILVLVATIFGQFISSILKLFFGRERPDVVPHLAEVSTASFPSGHSVMAAVVYLTLGTLLARMETRRTTKIYTLSVAVLVTMVVGMSRVYLGVHYPTDVAAGWLIGGCWALLCWLVARHLQKRGTVEDPEEEEMAGSQ